MTQLATPEEERPVDGSGERTGGGIRAMSFLAHLEELRRRIFWGAVGLIVAVAACYAVSDHILAFLLAPIEDAMGPLTVIRPAEAFMNKLKASLVGGVFVGLPWLAFQVWSFVAPGLYRRERRWVVPFVTCATALFLAGAAFCYWVALPTTMRFLAEQGEGFESSVTIDNAFAFSSKLLLGLGVCFELPLVTFVLSRLGIVTPPTLLRRIDIAIFACFLIAAIITPTPDILTMSLFAVPMILLYLLGVFVAWLAMPRDRD